MREFKTLSMLTTQDSDKHTNNRYTRLLLDVLRGKQATFVRDDELLAAWEIFTPVLHEIDHGAIKPIPYVFGTRGPKESDELIQKVGFTHSKKYAESWQEARSAKGKM